MAVGGLVLTLHPDPLREQAVLRVLAGDPRLEQGPRTGRRLAVVATTDTLGEGHALCEALLSLPGIQNLEVAYVAPEEELAAGAAGDLAPLDTPTRQTPSRQSIDPAPGGGTQKETPHGRQR